MAAFAMRAFIGRIFFDQSFFLKWRVRSGVEVTVLKNGALKS